MSNYRNENNSNTHFVILTLSIVLIPVLFWFGGPTLTRITNTHNAEIQKAHNETDYKTKKLVEDTARGMISTYIADQKTYETYKDSNDKKERGWALSAKERANRTASQYNNYILTNRNVWADNIPEDIKEELPFID